MSIPIKKVTMAKRRKDPQCKKGKKCRNSCIQKKRKCRVDPSANAVPTTPTPKKKTSKAKTFKKKTPKAKTPDPACDIPPRASAAPRASAPPPAKRAPEVPTTECGVKTLEIAKMSAKDPKLSKAYKKATLVCHPDKGGTAAEFQCLKYHYDNKRFLAGKIKSDERGAKPKDCKI